MLYACTAHQPWSRYTRSQVLGTQPATKLQPCLPTHHHPTPDRSALHSEHTTRMTRRSILLTPLGVDCRASADVLPRRPRR